MYKLIADSKPNIDGKPVSITLQPIPDFIRKDAVIIYRLEQERLDTILRVFGNLDDVHSRFASLQLKAATYKSFFPRFISALATANDTFDKEREPFVQELGTYLNDSRTGGTTPDSSFVDKAETLVNQHNLEAAGYIPPMYEAVGGTTLNDRASGYMAQVHKIANLTVLEQVYDDFQRFLAVVDSLGQKSSTLDDVINAAIKFQDIALFVMPPMGTSTTGNLMRFKKLATSGKALYVTLKTTIPAFFLYLEDVAALRSAFPRMDLATVDSPIRIRGTKTGSSDGTMSWVTVPHVSPLCHFDLNLFQNQGYPKPCRILFRELIHYVLRIVMGDQPLENFDGNGSFTIIAKAS